MSCLPLLSGGGGQNHTEMMYFWWLYTKCYHLFKWEKCKIQEVYQNISTPGPHGNGCFILHVRWGQGLHWASPSICSIGFLMLLSSCMIHFKLWPLVCCHGAGVLIYHQLKKQQSDTSTRGERERETERHCWLHSEIFSLTLKKNYFQAEQCQVYEIKVQVCTTAGV